jgi:hypothetical protein
MLQICDISKIHWLIRLPMRWRVLRLFVKARKRLVYSTIYSKPKSITIEQTWGCPLDLDITSISLCVVLAKLL